MSDLFAIPPVVIPDAGSLLRQVEQNQQPNLPNQSLPKKKSETESNAPEGPVITVKVFRFAGNMLLGGEKLSPVVASYLDRSLDFTQLQEAAAAIANAYREAGWIVRAYLPAQNIVDGVVTIQIVEAVYGKTIINGEIPTRADSEQIVKIFDGQQKSGDFLCADKLDRALLLADDLPGVTVVGGLREGTKDRETDLDLRLGEKPLLSGEIRLDNFGARSTGSGRITADLALSSPFKLGDLVSSNLIKTQGSDYVRLDGSIPVGSDGARTSVNASAFSYNLVAPEFSALHAHGQSKTVGIDATYPFIRSRLSNIYLNVGIDSKTFNNLSSGVTTTNYKSTSFTIGMNANLFDGLGGGGSNSASLSLVDGRLNLDGSPNYTADSITTRTSGQFAKLDFGVSRQQFITQSLSLFGSLSGQISDKNLDSSEKFYLGGTDNVRSYPANEVGGAQGQLLNLELRWRLHEGYNIAGFYDLGHVTINNNNKFPGAAALNDYSLKGLGLSLDWQTSWGPNLKVTYSHRIGNNPNPTLAGNDQDGSLLKNRFWVSLNIPFSGGNSGSIRTINLSSQELNDETAKAGRKSITDKASLIVGAPDNSAQLSEVKTDIAQAPASEEISASKLTTEEQLHAPLVDLGKVSDGTTSRVILFATVRFDGNSADVSAGSQAELIRTVKYAKDHPTESIEIDGYENQFPVIAHHGNESLSLQRAESVKHQLIIFGIQPSRITTKGLRSQNPISNNSTKEGRAKNRRAEIRFIFTQVKETVAPQNHKE